MDDDIELQALAWRDRLEDDRSAATRRAFEAWRAADARHAEAFDQQGQLAVGIRAANWRGVMPQASVRPARRWLGYGLAGMAAAAVALLLVAPHGATIGVPSTLTIAAMPPLTEARRLQDGSLVLLSAGAQIAADRAGDPRAARLVRGAARFLVFHDPAHPFRVTAGERIVTARGTVFDIALTATGARVALIEGRIDVTQAMGATDTARVVTLRPGEALSPGAERPVAAVAAPEPITWVEVDSMTLGDLLTIAARSNGDAIGLAEPSLARLRITGRFDLSNPVTLAGKLAAALDLRVTRRGSRTELGRSK